jgi:hypothetical protein
VRNLSKSKLLAFRQCPKRMWLEIHRPELAEISPGTQAMFKAGHQVGDIARNLYDPDKTGTLLDAQTGGYRETLEQSRALLATAKPMFEAGFSIEGAIAFADIMLPVQRGGKLEWRMVEVKSSTGVHDYQREDAAIQAFIALQAGVPLSAIALAHIDSKWVYPGDERYSGLLAEEDLTEEAFARATEVRGWLDAAHSIAEKSDEPKRSTGSHCSTPFECGFARYCKSGEPQPVHSPSVLPRAGKKIKSYIEEQKVLELEQIPDNLLSPMQLRVKQHTLSGETFFDATGAAAELVQHKLPALFLDFETVSFAVPIWKGTRPYQQIPFQFSLHRLTDSGGLHHTSFLNLEGADPSEAFAHALIDACGKSEPVFVYNAAFEKSRISELAKRFPALQGLLLAINERLVDLLPIAQKYYYHPSQQGSWSIKSLLPAVIPELNYGDLEEVKDGVMAMSAFAEAIHPETSILRKTELHRSLSEYCKLDTYAMVRVWQVFAGREALAL